MNTYKQPEIKVINYEVQDFIAASVDHDNAFGDFSDLFGKN